MWLEVSPLSYGFQVNDRPNWDVRSLPNLEISFFWPEGTSLPLMALQTTPTFALPSCLYVPDFCAKHKPFQSDWNISTPPLFHALFFSSGLLNRLLHCSGLWFSPWTRAWLLFKGTGFRINRLPYVLLLSVILGTKVLWQRYISLLYTQRTHEIFMHKGKLEKLFSKTPFDRNKLIF